MVQVMAASEAHEHHNKIYETKFAILVYPIFTAQIVFYCHSEGFEQIDCSLLLDQNARFILLFFCRASGVQLCYRRYDVSTGEVFSMFIGVCAYPER